jgi:hypothetical protein
LPIPNVGQTIIDPVKLHGYLLSRTHPVGRFEAAFFEGLGYAAEERRWREADLRTHHLSQEAIRAEANSYGQKYEIRATLVGPAGRKAVVLSVWMVLTGKRSLVS